MRPLSNKTKLAVMKDKFYRRCALKDYQHLFGTCSGRLTIDHSIIFAGKQTDTPWSLVSLCAKHHGVDEWQDITSVQRFGSMWVALNRATDEELEAVSKVVDYKKMREKLNKEFGVWEQHEENN